MKKDDFLSLFKTKEAPKEITVQGKTVYVRALTLEERTRYEMLINDGQKRDVTNLHAKFLCFALANEKGERLFSEDDIPSIGQSLPGAVGLELFDAAWKHNCMGQEQIEELKKSSEGKDTTGSSSISASP